ncbi:ATP-binding protein [Gallaecimonas sp. GXIMD1310]|uniref:ATP-binding protein n=1 Tax=Gallaecimonas sp. GXIMD1310 TaxID=3131926 RepID=UPI00324CBA37
MAKTPSVEHFRHWLWRAFIRHSLIPLLLVESLLVVIYLYTNANIRNNNIQYLRNNAITELNHAASSEGLLIETRLESVEQLLSLYRQQTKEVLDDRHYQATPSELANYRLAPNGVFHSIQDDGGAASFYSAITPADKQDRAKVYRLSQTDPLMRSMVNSSPLITQVYFNSFDSYNRIYPFFDTLSQYDAKLDIPRFNFYYAADAVHNPQRKTVWTEVYADPAGGGWMTSAVAPVYRGNFLEGVVGADVTVGRFIQQIEELDLPWGAYGVLLDQDLAVLAMPKQGQQDFALDMTAHHYQSAIQQETRRPPRYYLDKRQDTAALARAIRKNPGGTMNLLIGGKQKMVAWTTIPANSWVLLSIVDEGTLFANTEALSYRYKLVGYLMIGGLAAFYLLFFLYIRGRSQDLGETLSKPMDTLTGKVQSIEAGHYLQQSEPQPLLELQQFSDSVCAMGQALGRTVEALEISETRLRQALKSSGDSVWEYDIPSHQLRLSNSFDHFVGREIPKQISFDEFVDWVHEDDRDKLCQSRDEAIETGNAYSVDFRIQHQRGHWVWINSRGQMQPPIPGQGVRLTGVYANVSQRKALEQHLRQAKEAAEDANKAKSLFLSSVTHELKTPLHAILGFGQLLKAQVTDSGQRAADEILKAGNYLNQLIEDLLTHARLEAASLSVELTVQDMADIAADCVSMLSTEVANAKLELVNNITGPLPCMADKKRATQILINLLSNAIKYNQSGGRITLEATMDDSNIGIVVADTGKGIAAENLDKIFEPFERLEHQRSAIQGTGIGLAVSRQLAELMSGKITVVSQQGVGSRFTLWLPIAQGEGE